MTSNLDKNVGDQNQRPGPSLVDELKKAEYEPLLPIEKKLIGYSLGIGILLLGILVWTSRTMFDSPPSIRMPAGTLHK